MIARAHPDRVRRAKRSRPTTPAESAWPAWLARVCLADKTQP